MDSSPGFSLLSIIILICLSAFFSASETAVTASNRLKIKAKAEDGDKRAKTALKLIGDFDKTISTILIGNNIVNIAATSLATVLAISIWKEHGSWIATVVMTILVLAFGEILPKSLAKMNAEKLLISIASILRMLTKILMPISFIFSGFRKVVVPKDDDEDKKPSYTEDELKVIMDEVQDEGVLEDVERELAQNALDFDDMIMLTVRILEENPDILEKYRNRFKYILVDEYQDTNKAQFVLTSMLCNENKNIMVVGDDDQSIYKFRGATIENILDFDKVFKNTRVVKLEQNYRSTDMIIGAANAVIENNEGRKGKTLWTKTEGGEKITVKKCETQNAEAQYIVDKVGELVKDGKYTFSDFAVLYRMNAQSSTLETVFAKSGIPYRILGGTRFYDRKEIKDIIAYLCVMSNPFDNVRLKRIINVPKRGIGDATVDEVEKLAVDEGKDMLTICRNAAFYPSLSRAGARLAQFAEMIDELKKSVDVLSLGALVEKVLSVTGYMQMLKEVDEAESTDRAENAKELVSNAVQYQENNEEAKLSGFLEEVALISDIDNYDKEASAVVMMTIHSAKGLEFPVVFLPGLEENIFPGAQSVMEEEELEEERRLAYVAITRAKQRLFMLHCQSRMTYGKTEFNRRSRFVDEIPEKFCVYEGALLTRMDDARDTFMRSAYNSGYGNKQYQTGSYSKDNPPPWEKTSVTGSYVPKAAKQEAPKEVFRAGDAVTHAVFGDGMVLSAKAMAGDVLYEVAFDKVGTKKLMGNFAKLTKRV